MTVNEFSDQFDVLYNNITSNQAPGLNQYEKSLFLTKAQNELVKNYFSPKGNIKQDGFDDTPKRQADFATLIRSFRADLTAQTASSVNSSTSLIDLRTSGVYNSQWPNDVFIMLNELVFSSTYTTPLVVVPLSYEEYSRLMAKPYKYPPKYQVWRLITSNNQTGETTTIGSTGDTTVSGTTSTTTYTNAVKVQLISKNIDASQKYTLRYIKKPRPIILETLTDGLSIDNATAAQTSELPAELHEEILQRAVELAKVAWTATGQDNLQPMMEAGKRSE